MRANKTIQNKHNKLESRTLTHALVHTHTYAHANINKNAHTHANTRTNEHQVIISFLAFSFSYYLP